MQLSDVIALFDVIIGAIISIGLIIVAIKANKISAIALNVSDATQRELASIEHELKEGVYNDILHYIAILSSIRAKLGRGLEISEVETEMKHLKDSILTPGFLVLRSNIKSEQSRLFDDFLKIITEGNANRNDLLVMIDLLQGIICGINIKDINVKIPELMMTICEHEKNANRIYSPKSPERFAEFVKHLYDNGVNDADVSLFHGVFENSVEIVQKALDDGADTKCTDLMIVEKYRNDYDEFLKSNNK